MLVCNVSLRPPGRAIAAELAEAAAADDSSTTGVVVFATLVDDPASVIDYVDAYLGEIMLEAASAGDVLDAGLLYTAAIDELLTAAATQDAEITVVVVSATWNPSDKTSATTLSNGNLTAASNDFFAGVRATTGYNSGKRYFEMTMANGSSSADNIGLALASASLTTTAGSGTAALAGGGTIFVNGTAVGSCAGVSNGAILGTAADLTAQLIWFRVTPSGTWNNSGTANPATGTGGISISAVAGTLFPIFQVGAAVGHNATANFGATAFNGSVPSGFTSGW